jgi:hypothetical protein
MELDAPIPFPAAADAADETTLTEIEVAIRMVEAGVATRVRVAGVSAAVADRVAGIGAARAGAAGLRFVVERSTLSSTVTVGPRA